MQSRSKSMSRSQIACALLAAACGLIGVLTLNNLPKKHKRSGDLATPLRRRLLDPRTVQIKDFPFNVPERAKEWCMESASPPIDYGEFCVDSSRPINRVRIGGGLTNALKIVLLGAIRSFEEGRCFFLDETHAHLQLRNNDEDRFEELSFYRRYFYPVGLNANDPRVKLAWQENRVEAREFVEHLWRPDEIRRAAGTMTHLPWPDYQGIEGHDLKRNMIRRVWRLLPQWRDQACSSLESYGLGDDYMAFSFRRGDKDTEVALKDNAEYFRPAEEFIQSHFGGVAPKIFVATDDCDVMGELRAAKPEWVFTSECDRSSNQHGYVVGSMLDWSHEETDRHFTKFFAELYALVSAKAIVGVSYTNVTWWYWFMRESGDTRDIKLIDILGQEEEWFRSQ